MSTMQQVSNKITRCQDDALQAEAERQDRLEGIASNLISMVSQLKDDEIRAIIDRLLTLPVEERGRFIERHSSVLVAMQAHYSWKVG